MKLSQLSNISSERGLRSVLSSLFFGAKGALLSSSANFEQVTRMVSNLRASGYQDRADAIQASQRFTVLEEAVTTAAMRAASIQTYADTHGVVLEVNFAPDLARGKDLKQLMAASEASGVDIEVIKRKEQESIKRRYDTQAQAQSMAETMFWSAGYEDDVEVRTETVLNALNRQRDYMLEWTSLDLGELTIIRHDIAFVFHLLEIEEQAGESSEGTLDEGMIRSSDAQMQYKEFASQHRRAPDPKEATPAPKKMKRVKKGVATV